MYTSSSFHIKDKDKWEDFKKVYAKKIEFIDEKYESGSVSYVISGTTFIPDHDNFLKVISELLQENSVCTILTLMHNINCQGNFYLYGRVDTVTPHSISTIPFEDNTVISNIKPELCLLVGGKENHD